VWQRCTAVAQSAIQITFRPVGCIHWIIWYLPCAPELFSFGTAVPNTVRHCADQSNSTSANPPVRRGVRLLFGSNDGVGHTVCLVDQRMMHSFIKRSERRSLNYIVDVLPVGGPGNSCALRQGGVNAEACSGEAASQGDA
jgi:hypothetical protein